MKKSDEQVVVCQHCGNRTPHELLHAETRTEAFYDSQGEAEYFDAFFYLVKCRTCDGISLYVNSELGEYPQSLADSTLLYPKEKELNRTVPRTICKDYEEARKVEKISPRAFVVLIRRAFEGVCKDKHAHGANLQAKIQDLAKNKIIPDVLAEMADAIRLLGNIGAHDEDLNLGEQDVEDMNSFFTTLVEYVYVAPQKLAALKKRIDEGKAKAGKK